MKAKVPIGTTLTAISADRYVIACPAEDGAGGAARRPGVGVGVSRRP